MTTQEIKNTVKQMIDSLESMQEKLQAYDQQPTSTDQTAFTFYFHNGEADNERAANGIFAER
jgi:hypothetical protein